MADGTVGVQQAASPDRLIDNRTVTNDNGDTVYRQRVEVAQPDVTAAVATVTASGDTTVITPTAGKRLRVYWVYAVPDPDSADSPLIKVKLGGTEIYRAFAISHAWRFTGATDGTLVVNLSAATADGVAVTIHYEEITP